MKKITNLLGVLLAIWAMLFASCKKSDKNDDGTPNANLKEVILSKSSGIPGQAIEVTVPNVITSDHYILDVAGTTVFASRTGNHTFLLTIPYLPPGEYKIDLSKIASSTQLTFSIANYTPIADVEAVKETILNYIKSGSDPIKEAPYIDAFNRELKKVSLDEQKKQLFMARALFEQIEDENELEKFSDINLAMSMSKMQNGISERINSNSQSRFASILTKEWLFMPIWELGGQMEEVLSKYRRLALSTFMLAAGTAIGLTGAPVIGLAYVVLAAWHLRNSLDVLANLEQDIFGVPAIVILEKLNIKQSSTIQTRTTSIKLADKILLEKNTPLEREVYFKFASISINLETKVKSVFFTEFFSAYRKLIGIYRPLYNGKKRVEDFLGFSYDIPNPDELLAASSTIEEREVEESDFSIENISKSGLILVKKKGEEGVIFTASSEQIKEKVEFTFDIVFKQPKLGTEGRHTINAVYDGRTNPHQVERAGGNNQMGVFGKKLKDKLQVKVTDKEGIPMENVQVIWTTSSTSGTLNNVENKTNILGIATAEWTLGTSGKQEVTVIVNNLEGKPVIDAPLVFTAMNVSIIGNWKATELYRNNYFEHIDLNGKQLLGYHIAFNRKSTDPNCIGFHRTEERTDLLELEFKDNMKYRSREKGFYSFQSACSQTPTQENYDEISEGVYKEGLGNLLIMELEEHEVIFNILSLTANELVIETNTSNMNDYMKLVLKRI